MTRPVASLSLVAACACLALAPSLRAQASRSVPAGPRASAAARTSAPQPSTDGITLLLQKIEQAVRSGNATGYEQMMAPGVDADVTARFTESVIRTGATRVAVRERDRAPLAGMPSGDGYRLAVDVFCEFGRRARLSTWRLDVVRRGPKAGGDGAGDEWAIKGHEMLSSFGALYNLALAPRQFAAKDLVLTSEDLELRLPEGAVFVAETDEGPTTLVLVGRGHMFFRPAPEAERIQVKIFAGSDAVDTAFDAAFVRLAPSALEAHIARGTMTERSVDQKAARTAAEVFRADSEKSYGVNLGDLTPEKWYLIPGNLDFLAEVHTKKFGVLTYARSAHEAEDVTLFDRASRHNISLYASPWKLTQRGPFYAEDDEEDYDVTHYDLDISIDPSRQMISGVARLAVRVRASSAATLTLKLAESLVLDGVVSREFGRVVAMPILNQNSCLVNLPQSVPKGGTVHFTIAYHGRLAPQPVDREVVSVEAPQNQYEEAPDIPLEPSYLYSNRSYWYPQGQTNTFATATIRVRVPAGYTCVASGDPEMATAETMARSAQPGEFVYRALQPVRYLSVLITRLTPIRTQAVNGPGGDATVDRTGRSGVFYPTVDFKSFASPHMRGRAQPLANTASDILHFYSSLMGDYPYPSLTLALVERELPGGHSPGYLAVVSQPVLSTPYDWRGDPTSFPQFPEFFLAHEIAHQWWGQAVGWKNYHEQWLSEGLSQYFAALYAEHIRGKEVFGNIIKRMQDWAVKKSSEGPVYLGYRIGHVKRDPQLFRAIIYNKSAVVLHMLRRFVGDDAFFRGLRRFYQDWRFRKAGSDDLRLALEAESHKSLSRFFDRWIYDSRLPKMKFSWKLRPAASTGAPTTAVLRFEQVGNVFDVPVTVTLDYRDRSPVDVLVQVTEAITEVSVPVEGKLRDVQVNRDQAAVGKIER